MMKLDRAKIHLIHFIELTWLISRHVHDLILLFPVRNLFKEKWEIKSKGNFRTGITCHKGIIKKRNIPLGQSHSSGSIITPSLVKTPFTCYVPLFSFFFGGGHQRNIKNLISPWLLRFHFCNLMSPWENKMRLAGFHKGSHSALFFQYDLSNRFLEFQKWVFQSRSAPFNLRATYTK